jgi:hypothetical protein
MKLTPLMIGCFVVLLAACGCNGLAATGPVVEVEMYNQSSRDLENAEARFGEHICRWGWVVKTSSKSYMDYPHPVTPKVELHWDAEGTHRVEMLDLSKIYPRGKSGRLRFIVDNDRVSVIFHEKP